MNESSEYSLDCYLMFHQRIPRPMDGRGAQRPSRTGRIKVIGVNSSDYGYLGNGNTAIATSLGAGASKAEAISFCYKPGRGVFEIEIKVT